MLVIYLCMQYLVFLLEVPLCHEYTSESRVLYFLCQSIHEFMHVLVPDLTPLSATCRMGKTCLFDVSGVHHLAATSRGPADLVRKVKLFPGSKTIGMSSTLASCAPSPQAPTVPPPYLRFIIPINTTLPWRQELRTFTERFSLLVKILFQ